MKAEIARGSLAEFVRQAWHVVEPGTPLLNNWHIEAVCEHLQAVSRGEIQKLVINIPPGHCKSLIVSVMWPAWEWIDKPEERSLFSSYAMDLAIRDSVRCRDVIESEWYQEAFEPRWRAREAAWKLKVDQNVKSYFENTRKGFRFCLSVGSRSTGFRGGKVVTDDPLNAKELHSKLVRDECIFWWDKVMSSRLNDPRTGKRVIIMQRLHEEDLSGHVLKNLGYQHLCLPSQFDPARKSKTFIMQPVEREGPEGKRKVWEAEPFWEDPRTQKGELLHAELFTPEVIAQAKVDLGEDFEGQHQQQPMAEEGGILKKAWWKYYTIRPAKFDEMIQSWDMAFKDTKGSDYVCGQVWGRVGASRYLIAQVHAKLSFDGTCEALVNLSAAHPLARAKLVEEKANGAAVINHLKHRVSGLIAVVPGESKEARAWAAQPDLKAGNYYLPAVALPENGTPVLEQWVTDLITECSTFPRAANDDRVDAFTQADQYFASPKQAQSVPGWE